MGKDKKDNNVPIKKEEFLKKEDKKEKENISAPLYLWAHYIKTIKDMKGGLR